MNKSFIHRANKNRVEEQDIMRKSRLIQLLRKNFGIIAIGLIPNIYLRDRVTNEIIITTGLDSKLQKLSRDELFRKYQINLPDLYVKNGIPKRIIELDGEIHGFYDEITESQQTTDRNENYRLGGFKTEDGTLVIITAEDEKLTDEDLVKLLSVKLKIPKT